jgi:hypothetical protein
MYKVFLCKTVFVKNVYTNGYTADRLGVQENNIGNGGKHTKKKGVTNKMLRAIE